MAKVALSQNVPTIILTVLLRFGEQVEIFDVQVTMHRDKFL